MPTGRDRRAANKALADQRARDAARESDQRQRLAAEELERRAVEAEYTPMVQYRFESYVGYKSAYDLKPERIDEIIDAARILLAEGALAIRSTEATWQDVTKLIWLVAGPRDLDRKITAFKTSFRGMMDGWHPKGFDFANLYAPGRHWTWNSRFGEDSGLIYQDYWFAPMEGVIFTLDEQVARKVRAAYLGFYRQHLPDLDDKTTHGQL